MCGCATCIHGACWPWLGGEYRTSRSVRPGDLPEPRPLKRRASDGACPSDEELADHARQVVDSLPPLTDEQREVLSLIFRGDRRKRDGKSSTSIDGLRGPSWACRLAQAEPGCKETQFFPSSSSGGDRQDGFAHHGVMACLLWCDAACLLQASQAACQVAGHDVAASQVDVVVTTADRWHRVRKLYPRRAAYGLAAVLQFHGNGDLMDADWQDDPLAPEFFALGSVVQQSAQMEWVLRSVFCALVGNKGHRHAPHQGHGDEH
jgi:hypothetical protein